MVLITAIRLRGSEIQTPARPEICNEISASCAPHAPPMGPQHQVPEPVLSMETHHQQMKGRSNWCRYVSHKEETRMKCNGRKVKRGKGDGHQHGRYPRIPEPVPIAWKLS